ncbi:hypoxanthine phosphoribosyltransferase [Celerinatantimonas yamalensis]|uniref:Hypoxanthine phosphoribosyltransferase n=1 Tax=Celerinatantimonas yamalensis TaxID=559956 RepID=A0ABW9GAB2_9GAMM
MKHSIELLIDASQIADQVKQIGAQISQRYPDPERPLVLVGLLRGSCLFLADLCRQLERPVILDFMNASSYGNAMQSTRDVRVLKDLDDDIGGADVVIVEDIIDTGYTLSKIREMLLLRQPHSLAICTLLDKPSRREVDVPVDWIGFSIPDEFVVGYGIDYAQRYRNLPFIGKVIPE